MPETPQQPNPEASLHNFRYIVTLPGILKIVQLLFTLVYFTSYFMITCLEGGGRLKLILILCVPTIGFFSTCILLIMSMVQLIDKSKVLSRTKKELRICIMLGVYYTIATIGAILSDSMKPDHENRECLTKKSGDQTHFRAFGVIEKIERIDRNAYNCALCFGFLAAMVYAVDASLRWKASNQEENPQNIAFTS